MNLKTFPFGSATAQAAALRKGQVSSVELLKAYLARVDRFNPALNALVVASALSVDTALKQDSRGLG